MTDTEIKSLADRQIVAGLAKAFDGPQSHGMTVREMRALCRAALDGLRAKAEMVILEPLLDWLIDPHSDEHHDRKASKVATAWRGIRSERAAGTEPVTCDPDGQSRCAACFSGQGACARVAEPAAPRDRYREAFEQLALAVDQLDPLNVSRTGAQRAVAAIESLATTRARLAAAEGGVEK